MSEHSRLIISGAEDPQTTLSTLMAYLQQILAQRSIYYAS